MNASECFEVWARPDDPWSPWVKPVLFAEEFRSPESNGPWSEACQRASTLWKPAAMPGTALVLDLPGPLALAVALECAPHGWRPVPLFNSCTGAGALLDNEPLRAGLAEGAQRFRSASWPAGAAPAFVLDARRTQGVPAPKGYDNRWVVFPQDFPSAARLLAHGVHHVCLVQEGRAEARNDLAHVLLRWQRAGISILTLDLAAPASPAPLKVKKPAWFRSLGYRIFLAFGLRKSSAGGFGARVPAPSSGGGGFYG